MATSSKNPLSGFGVNREGNVVDGDGNVERLTTGEVSICAGKEIDDDGDVVDSKGSTIGNVSLIQDIPEPKESPQEKEKREQAETDKKLAQQMAYCLTQVLDKIKPISDMITRKIEAAERTPKEELDEEELVRQVRPVIEEGGKILSEANGIIRGLDPDGQLSLEGFNISGPVYGFGAGNTKRIEHVEGIRKVAHYGGAVKLSSRHQKSL